MGSLPNMLRSLLVIGLIVLGVIAIVPRSSQTHRPTVDAAAVARTFGAAAGVAALVPVGLPGDGWRSTVATDAAGTDSVRTFTSVWTTPAGKDIALRQAKSPSDAWLRTATYQGAVAGSVQVAGRSWERWVGPEERVSLVSKGSGDQPTVVVAGTAADPELAQFAGALKPVAGS